MVPTAVDDRPPGRPPSERSWPASAARPGNGSGAAAAAPPLGWTVPGQPRTPVPPGIRAAVWFGAFILGLMIAAFVLRKAGLLDVDTVIDLYAGSGPGRFGILLALLPLWAVLSATIAHLSLEALARRRRPDGPASSPNARASSPDRPADAPSAR
ncbi:MAG TPA: hypothetical protein VEG38_06630 [Acidimicrobiia bacterium]|nr:hypothetical protein [Acidimicrobiia bacterium]